MFFVMVPLWTSWNHLDQSKVPFPHVQRILLFFGNIWLVWSHLLPAGWCLFKAEQKSSCFDLWKQKKNFIKVASQNVGITSYYCPYFKMNESEATASSFLSSQFPFRCLRMQFLRNQKMWHLFKYCLV